MQRIVFSLVLFSFCMLSFSASRLFFLKSKTQTQTVFSLADQLGAEEENEKEEEVRDAQVLIPGRFVFGIIGKNLNRFECFNLKLTNNFKLIHTPPPRD